ncbi:hypothetical protein ATANTOWER_031720 [Ataeniobius toweri]|uniref:Uncharacterized protein n=1 Tax=Ataeniobius toweri TaxID=208326 RepID=A0ABU7BW74_9TELE|nr:hypothetical protein [Ataeniobius toweri]
MSQAFNISQSSLQNHHGHPPKLTGWSLIREAAKKELQRFIAQVGESFPQDRTTIRHAFHEYGLHRRVAKCFLHMIEAESCSGGCFSLAGQGSGSEFISK